MKKGKPTKLATANQPFTPLTKKAETEETSFIPLQLNDLKTPKNKSSSHSSSLNDELISPMHLPTNINKKEQNNSEITLDAIREYFVKGIEMIDKYKAQQTIRTSHELIPSEHKNNIQKNENVFPNKQIYQDLEVPKKSNLRTPSNQLDLKTKHKQTKQVVVFDDIPDDNENSSEVRLPKSSNLYNDKETPIEKKVSPYGNDFSVSMGINGSLSSGSPHGINHIGSGSHSSSHSEEDIQQRMMQMSALLRRLEKQLDDLQQ